MKTKISQKTGRVTRRASVNMLRKAVSASAADERTAARLKLDSILVPIDFSEPSEKALRYALPFAEQFGAKITLLHVVEPVAMPDFASFPLIMENDRVARAFRTKLDSLCKREAIKPRLIEKTLVRFGKPFQEICESARGLRIGLIVMSTRGYTGLKQALLGSTTERVVRHAPCPVLVVREQEHEFV